MIKKVLVVCSFILVIFIGIALYFFAPEYPKYTPGGYCPFCDPHVIAAQSIYEDDLVIALLPTHPVTEGHTLIIPKRHVACFDLLTDEETDKMMRLIKRVDGAAKEVLDISPYLLLQKNGKEVGQSVFHVHFHYIPRKAGESSIFKLVLHILLSNYLKPLSPEVYENLRIKMHAHL